MNSVGTYNYQWAFQLIDYFSQQGVTQAVISPGSRSTPLALACEKHPDITTWIQVDERSAGFFALGLAQKNQIPTILICTSGSAVANWYPAVVEANYSYTPLLLLSADRPAELQNCGANQTIDQSGLFSSHVRDSVALKAVNKTLLEGDYLKKMTIQAYDKAINTKPGPVHINIPFNEPLLPQGLSSDKLNQHINQLSQKEVQKKSNISSIKTITSIPGKTITQLEATLNKGNGLIVCGRLSHIEHQNFQVSLGHLAETLNCPVLLDPLSNCRLTKSTSSHYIYNYDHFLKNQFTLKPDWIIRIGQFPTSKSLLLYLDQIKCHTFLVSSFGDRLDPIHKVNTTINTLPMHFCQQVSQLKIKTNSSKWLKHWQDFEYNTDIKIQEALTNCTDLFEGHVIKTLLENIPDNSLLFSANSMAIRDLDTFITHSNAMDKNISLHCNRGSSGIDGNVSTFLGLLSQQNKPQYGVALLGDLTFYHDMNGLLICKQLNELGINASIIIINNNGGGIFNYLPQSELNEFDKLWNTPIHLDFQPTAKLYGLDYHRIDDLKTLQVQLPNIFTGSGIQIVEVIINQETSVECHRALKS
ncbi:MAG: 2-succinyl-5-enolpyruvyl-6-hydroxy-3-cyclohexene-1-carboxylic-acid synthase [Gammaproteobacteria bacterium]|nr:2-succinyl-5-enolpyruvyl-6-hydroxy-3-cyclohexene-1-carboxylic-acid synthase [Gammaproteobacteria bacterium]